jgi:molecular chaperone GrpE (heat shock protein)
MSGAKISQMQGKLRELEDQLMVAQHHSEEYVNTHEEEVRQMQEAQNSQLKRKPSLLSPKSIPGTPLNPVFALKSPRLDRTTSGMGLSIGEASRTDALEKRVQELERALSDADREMSEVVSRMNKAQMEVAELQSERYVSPLSHSHLILTSYAEMMP